MAIYHFHISSVSRAKTSSSCATVSYITGKRIYDERLDKTFYGFAMSRRERVILSNVILPDGAPKEYYNPEALTNGIEMCETAANAVTAKKIECALPDELPLDDCDSIVRKFISDNLTSMGYAAVYAIHADPETSHNTHVHILVPNRQIDPDLHTWAKQKTKKDYALDEDGNRIPVIDPATGMQKLGPRNTKIWKRVTVLVNKLTEKSTLLNMRKSWADCCNEYLAPDSQIDHRSYADQGIDKIPTIHEGYAAREIEGRGGSSERMEANRAITRANALVAKNNDLMYKRDKLQLQILFREARFVTVCRCELLQEKDGSMTPVALLRTDDDNYFYVESPSPSRLIEEGDEIDLSKEPNGLPPYEAFTALSGIDEAKEYFSDWNPTPHDQGHKHGGVAGYAEWASRSTGKQKDRGGQR